MKKNFIGIIRDSTVSDAAKLIYMDIYDTCDKNGECKKPNSYFAELHGKKPDTICRIISELAKSGYISVEVIRDHRGTSRIIRLNK